jgi:SPP1 family predicted phage head-tail adaptor
MNFRSLRNRITIQKQTSVSNGQGGREVTWVDDFTTWAKIKSDKNRITNDFEGGKPLSVVDQVIEMRYRPGISPMHRVMYQGRVMEIKEVHNILEADKKTRLICEEEQV